MSRQIQRTCSVCGDEITVTVYDDGTYDGGNYWSGLFDDDDGYWECLTCFQDDDGHDDGVVS